MAKFGTKPAEKFCKEKHPMGASDLDLLDIG